jgi:peptide subunit release factor RF-3
MEVRKNVKLEGIPICRHTNLSDDEVRQLYEILKEEPTRSTLSSAPMARPISAIPSGRIIPVVSTASARREARSAE